MYATGPGQVSGFNAMSLSNLKLGGSTRFWVAERNLNSVTTMGIVDNRVSAPQHSIIKFLNSNPGFWCVILAAYTLTSTFGFLILREWRAFVSVLDENGWLSKLWSLFGSPL